MSDMPKNPRRASAGPAGEAPVRTGRHASPTLVVLFLSLAGLAFAVLQSLVAPALPVLAEDLRASTSDISWVLTAYLLSAAVFTPVLARLGDMAGKRRMLLVTLAVLGTGTLLAGLSPNLPLLIVARVLQGAGGAVLPLSVSIVRDELPAKRVGVTVGLLSAIFGIGGGLGIVLAGPIVDSLSWEWLFWFPLVLVVVAFAGVAFGVPESPVRTPGRLDLLGAGVLGASLVAFLLGITKGGDWGWSQPQTLIPIAAGLLGLVMFVLLESRVREPLVDVKLFARRGVWATNLVGLVFGFVMFAMFLLIPILLELPAMTGYGFGKTVTQAGLFLLPATVMIFVFGPVSGLLDQRFGPRLPMVLGALVVTAGFLIPTLEHGASGYLLASCFILGAGVGLALAAMSNAIIESVPVSQTAEATGVNQIVREVGGSIGTAVMAAVLSSNATPLGLPTDRAFTIGFAICAAAGALSIVGALALPARRGSRERSAAGAAV